MKIGVIHERKPTKEGGETDFAGLALKAVDELSGSRFNDVRVRFNGTGAEATIPQPSPISVCVSIEHLEVFGGAKVLARIVPCNGRITKSGRQYV